MIALDSCVALHPLKPESKENTLTLKKLVIVFLTASQQVMQPHIKYWLKSKAYKIE